MSSPPPVEFHPGMEIVPGYTLIAPLGSGMAGDVWQAQAAGGIKVALKVVRNLKDLGGRKELKALKTIRDVHHPNLCPLFGFWTKDAEGRVLADGETEDLNFDSISSVGLGLPANSGTPGSPPPAPDSGRVSGHNSGEIGGTMAIGSGMPHSGATPQADAPAKSKPAKPKVTAEQLIVVMGLGDCTLYDRLKYVRQEAGLDPNDIETPYGLDPVETVRYLRASASAIDLLNQEHQIYHCDIKPQNILLVGGEAQVCDFGLAKQMEGDLFQTQQAFATPAYAPPEVLHGEGYSRQVDQYSLAVTYYELRTGLLPFDVTTHASMLVAKSTGKLNLDALTPAERKVLQKALRRVPSERYDSCTDFINAIAVASGVEKSGGITVKRIVASVAVLLLAIGLGIGAWSVLFPQSFYQAFHRSEVEIAKDLEAERANYERTESLEFSQSHVTLTQVMNRSSAIASISSGEPQADAEVLFSDAATRLISRIHEALRQFESLGLNSLDDKTAESLQDCLDGLSLDNPDPESVVAAGLQRWSQSSDSTLRELSNEYFSLYHAAVVRFAVLRGQQASAEHVDALRQALDNRPQDFSSGTSINLTLASLLPVLATIPAAETSGWTASEWLQNQHIGDLVRAAKAVRAYGRSSAYSSRWDEIRERFSIAVSPAMTRNSAQDLSIDNQTREQIWDGFPDLQLETQIAELRLSVEQSRWDDADRLLRGLESFDALNNDQSVLVKTAAALTRDRTGSTALESALKAINDAGIDMDRLRELRTQGLFTALMQDVGKRYMENPVGSARGLYTQMSFALWIEEKLSAQIPSEFLTAAALSLLRESPQLIGNPNGTVKLPLADWLDRLDKSTDGATPAAAIRMEQQIASAQSTGTSVDPILKALQSADSSFLDAVAPNYGTLLSACGKCIQGDDIEPQSAVLTSASRQSIESFGPSRLLIATDLLVRKAIEKSGVTDDDFVSLRYSANAANQTNVSRSRSYLSLADFLMRHSQQGVTAELATELFLQSVAAGGSIPSTTELPKHLVAKLDTRESAGELTTQVLKALHSVGIQELQRKVAGQEQFDTELQFLVRPAIVLLERFGKGQFGPRTGPSPAKTELFKNVIIPTVSLAVYEDSNARSESLLPKEVIDTKRWNDNDVQRFCQLASFAYTDPTARDSFDDDKSRYFRHCIAVGTLASRSSDLERSEQQAFRIRAARSAVSIENVGSDQLLKLADQFAKEGASHSSDYLRSEAYERIAEDKQYHGDRAGEKQNLDLALQAAEKAITELHPSDGQEILSIQRYELLSKYGDLGVQFAFLNDLNLRLPILQKAAEKASEAVDLYKPDWQESVRCPITSAYITKGNAFEDIAHYCSQDSDPVTTQRRESSFNLAIKAFAEAKRRNDQDLKTRFSLARCQYRYALTLDGDKKSEQLEDAIRSLGATPTDQPAQVSDRYLLSIIPEWFHWKLVIELEQDDTTAAIKLAAVAFEFVKDERVPIETRNILAYTCANAYIPGKDWRKAVECLMYLKEKGPASKVIQRMGLASDIEFAGLLPREAGDGSDSVFAEHLRILNLTPNDLAYTDADDEAYELAKSATRCVREQVARLSVAEDRRTATKKADLSMGVRLFARRLDRNQRGGYFALAETLYKGDDAAMNSSPVKLFEFACDLAQRIDSIPEPPAYANDREYIRRVCGLISYYSLGYWRAELAKASELQKQTMIADARSNLSPERLKAIVKCITDIAEQARQEERSADVAFAMGAIKMLEELAAEPQ